MIPDNLRAYELGQKQNLVTLLKVLSKYAFGKFWVTNSDEEQELLAVRRAFDDELDTAGRGVLYWMLLDGDAVAQCRLLLSVGIDPDKPMKHLSHRASHWTTYYGRPSCAEALAPCRPNLAAVDHGGEKPSIMRAMVSSRAYAEILSLVVCRCSRLKYLRT